MDKMNLIQTLNKLRQDIQTWVRNNILALAERKADVDHAHDYSELENTPNIEVWTFTLEDGTTVTKNVVIG